MRRSPLVLLVLAGACQSDEVRLSRPPQAFGGFDRPVPVGSEVALDASPSLDPDGDPLRYSWTWVHRPPESTARLDGENRRLVRFVVDRPGTYLVALVVDDGQSADTDLIGITAVEGSTTTPALQVVLPGVCHVDLQAIFDAPCGLSDRRVEITPRLMVQPAGLATTLRWSFLRLPPGIDEAELMTETPSGPLGELSFVAPRPGEYWVGAQLISDQTSSPMVVATVAVFSASIPAARRPIPVITAPSTARPQERVLLDARPSQIPTASVASRIDRHFTLLGDPSGEATLSDLATGCPPGQCRLLSPPGLGRYLVGLQLVVDGVESGTAVHALEVR
ncbi:MAG: hypothetical protein IPG45_03630 [Deltaproteobacteria bacterium]|nr:hypothetical protein [Deltaproteobacteria bacterium]